LLDLHLSWRTVQIIRRFGELLTGEANLWLVAGGLLSSVAALAHLATIAGGPNWYRAMGAGERMARMAAARRWEPVIVTLGISAALIVFSLYAFSGAHVLPRLPLLAPALLVVSGVYIGRGLFLFIPAGWWRRDLSVRFKLWSSVLVLGFGVVHVIGIWQSWTHLNG
jgi:hypothetical protein